MKKVLKALAITFVSTLSWFALTSCKSLLGFMSSDDSADTKTTVSDEETVAVMDEDFDPNYQTRESHSSYGNFELKFENGTVTVTPLDDKSTVVTNKDKDFETILDDYENKLTVTDLFIEEGIETIEEYTFSDMKKLETVHIPSTLETIKDYAFNKCVSLETVYGISNVTSLSAKAFAGTNYSYE